jgi:hypothetical protein
VDLDGDEPDLGNDTRRARIETALAELAELSKNEEAMARLHEIERMIAHDVLRENRHLRCEGCLAMVQALVQKANGEDWKTPRR